MRRFVSAVAILTAIVMLDRLPAMAAPGDLDPTFGFGGVVAGAGSGATDLALQSDGKVVVISATALSRYLTSGALDATFGTAGTEPPGGEAVAVEPDDEIIVARIDIQFLGASNFGGQRYDVDGNPGDVFGVGFASLPSFLPFGLPLVARIQPDGNFIFAGGGGPDSAVDAIDFALARFTPADTLDTSFSGDGKLLTDFGAGAALVSSLALQDDGRIIAVGNGSVFSPGLTNVLMARYEVDGDLDASFGTGGKVTLPTGARASAVALQSDGKVIVGGRSLAPPESFLVARYDTSGTLDPTFGTGGIVTTPIGLSSGVAAVAVELDDRIVAVGTAATVGGSDFAVAYYDVDGTLDASFGTGGIVTTTIGTAAAATTVVLQPNGKIIAGGSSDGALAMARYDVPPFCGDGNLDPGETCDAGPANGTTSCCSTGCEIRSAGEICRAQATPCDALETCEGFTSSCPADLVLPDGTLCDDSSSCTSSDQCTGGVCGGVAVVCAACQGCDPGLGCLTMPRTGCKQTTAPLRTNLRIRDRTPDRRDGFAWKWVRGGQTTDADLGDPLTTDPFTVCVYDESGPTPVSTLATVVPPGGVCRNNPCWRQGKRGLRYLDRDRAVAGIERIVVKTGDEGKAKILVKGRGENLIAPDLPISLPIRVQLHVGTDQCWEATYSADQFQVNTDTEFKGKAD